jgi:hypothetical protein
VTAAAAPIAIMVAPAVVATSFVAAGVAIAPTAAGATASRSVPTPTAAASAVAGLIPSPRGRRSGRTTAAAATLATSRRVFGQRGEPEAYLQVLTGHGDLRVDRLAPWRTAQPGLRRRLAE